MPRNRRGTRADRAKKNNESQVEIECYDPHNIDEEYIDEKFKRNTTREEIVCFDKELYRNLILIGDTNHKKGEDNPGKVWGYYSMGEMPKQITNMMLVVIDMLNIVNNDKQHFNARKYMDIHKEYINKIIVKNIKNGCDGVKIVIGGSIRGDGKNNYSNITPKKLANEFVEILEEIVPENFPYIVLSYSEKQENYYGETCVDDIVCLLGNHIICRDNRTNNANKLLSCIYNNIESYVGTYFDEKGYTRNVLLATSDFNKNSKKYKKEKGLTSFYELTEYYLRQGNCNISQIAMKTKDQSCKLDKLVDKGLITYRL